jgi:rare lipoprotein A
MIRTFLAATVPAVLIVGAAAFVLWAVPVHAAECVDMVASHYGKESGNRTASGSYFDGSQMVAAHRSWRFGTKLVVTYKGRSVRLVVADRGPFVKGRSLDISTAAARKIGLTKAGVDRVRVCRVG